MARELTWDEYVALMRSGIVQPLIRLDMCRPDGSVYDSFTKYPLPNSSLTIDCSSGCRRSLSLTLDNSDGTFLPNPVNGKMWMNLMFNLYVGVEDSKGNYKLFPQGVFCTANSQPQINSTPQGERTVTIKADDKWSLLNSQLGIIYQIPIGTLETDAIRSLLKEVGDNYTPIISEISDTSPYTLRWDYSSTYGNIFKDLANLYSREIYYDATGHLVFQNFTDLETLETEWSYSTNEVTYMGSSRTLNWNDVVNRVIVIASNSTNNKLYRAVAENNDMTSFVRLNYISTKTLTIQDDKIFSQDLCQQRADYELEQRKRVQESITLKSVNLPHMEVNKAINITDASLGLYNSRFAVQKIQFDLSFQSEMSLTCLKYSSGNDFENRVDISASDANNG